MPLGRLWHKENEMGSYFNVFFYLLFIEGIENIVKKRNIKR